MATTWTERQRELKASGQWLYEDFGPYPHFLTLARTTSAPVLAQAKRETDAPIRISEEWYPDYPDHCVVYVVASGGNLSPFWHRVDALEAQEVT